MAAACDEIDNSRAKAKPKIGVNCLVIPMYRISAKIKNCLKIKSLIEVLRAKW